MSAKVLLPEKDLPGLSAVDGWSKKTIELLGKLVVLKPNAL